MAQEGDGGQMALLTIYRGYCDIMPKLHFSAQRIPRGFADCRDGAGVTAPDGMTPPSIHKLRSLAARLYSTQGYDPQNLLGHKNAKTTAVYKDSRGAEWIDVAA